MTAVIPKKAATVILLRDKRLEGFEVFLLKRHEKSSFMGGNYVYPGGRVDREDGSLETCALCKGVTLEEAHRMFRELLSPEESLAHWIAGVRELFEEAGVLVAYDQEGNFFDLKNTADRARFSNYRSLLQKGELNICQIAQEEKLLFALNQLHYYAHWITPEARSERFDTRFFIARHPEGQEATYDRKETTEGVWVSPQKALEENLNGAVVLSPPTLKTLEDLSRFESMNAVFDSLTKQEIRPILPVLTKIPSGPMIIFPWDPDYEIFQRGELPSPINHGRPSQPGDHTTRVLMEKGRWLPFCRT
jgi:8-oxo-dGTP pyrophosphatase MutT (NUDIX family)